MLHTRVYLIYGMHYMILPIVSVVKYFFNDSHPVVFYDIIGINLFPSKTQNEV
jgi:hypothetical protein